MTARAVLLGLAGAAAVCGLTYVNDYVLRQTFLVGNFMPISVFGGLIIFLLVVNPLLFRWSRRLALKGKEIAVIVALTLAACYVPGRGLGHYFTTFLMLPRHYVRVEPGWKEERVVDMAPRRMLAGVAPEFRVEHMLDLPGLCSKLAGEGARCTRSEPQDMAAPSGGGARRRPGGRADAACGRGGMALYLAVLYTFGALILFLVLSRIVAETGVFFVNVPFSPCIVLWGLLGAKAIGPRACLMLFMVSSLLLIDPREALMPFIATGLKLVDMSKVKLGRTAGWGGAAVALGLAIALAVTLYVQHDYGAMTVSDGWTAGRANRRGIPRNPFDAVVGIKQRLAAQGELGIAGKQSGSAWLGSVSPNVPCLVGFGVAVGLVLLFTVCRLRFPRWPFHPVMFLVLSAWSSQMLAASFLLGWLAKTLTLRFGGARGAEKLKPLMFGLIAGDMLGGVIPMIIGAVHFAITKESPPGSFMVMPW